jgi:hypothetical protein
LNGDEVRDAAFPCVPVGYGGYDAKMVDELLGRLAVELDAGRPVTPLVENAVLKQGRMRYPLDSVDWFLAEVVRRAGRNDPSGMCTDPWSDLAVVAQVSRCGVGDMDWRGAGYLRRTLVQEAIWKRLVGDCRQDWDDFGRPPGLRLRVEWAGEGRRELRSADQQAIAWRSRRDAAVHLGDRRYKWHALGPKGSEWVPWPGVADVVTRSYLDRVGHFSGKSADSTKRARTLAALVNEAGAPVLCVSGANYDQRSYARISFPDKRWLRFLVRGTRCKNAVMTAVNQDGNKIFRCRINQYAARSFKATLEVAIHPECRLTDEILLAIMVSDSKWLMRYFESNR